MTTDSVSRPDALIAAGFIRGSIVQNGTYYTIKQIGEMTALAKRLEAYAAGQSE